MDLTRNVFFASADPTVYSPNCLSDLQSFQPVKFTKIQDDLPRLCRAHLELKVPIAFATAAFIRKYTKAGVWPRKEAIFYDLYTGSFGSGDEQLLGKFRVSITKPLTPNNIVRFFKRLHNIAKRHLTMSIESEDEDLPDLENPKTEIPQVQIENVELDRFFYDKTNKVGVVTRESNSQTRKLRKLRPTLALNEQKFQAQGQQYQNDCEIHVGDCILCNGDISNLMERVYCQQCKEMFHQGCARNHVAFDIKTCECAEIGANHPNWLWIEPEFSHPQSESSDDDEQEYDPEY